MTISGFVVGAVYRNTTGYRFRIVAVHSPAEMYDAGYDQVDYEWLDERADGRVRHFLANATKHHDYRREQYLIEEYPA